MTRIEMHGISLLHFFCIDILNDNLNPNQTNKTIRSKHLSCFHTNLLFKKKLHGQSPKVKS